MDAVWSGYQVRGHRADCPRLKDPDATCVCLRLNPKPARPYVTFDEAKRRWSERQIDLMLKHGRLEQMSGYAGYWLEDADLAA
jgi:hypothetical protein